MFKDNSLIPAEAIRLAALGLLAEAPRHYGDLAAEIRHFTSRIVGPSLDLLRYEGLIEAVDGEGMSDNAMLRLTKSGGAALAGLLKAQLRSPAGDMNRLALLMKLRFLHHLPEAERQGQLALMADSLTSERARLDELRQKAAPGLFRDWLERDLAMVDDRIAWLRSRGG